MLPSDALHSFLPCNAVADRTLLALAWSALQRHKAPALLIRSPHGLPFPS